MFIERVQVDAEGFLAGLDVSFRPGLNVLVGARGTGKTSLIELIRFCLDADSFTEEAGIRGRQQAVAILDGGAVTVTLNDNGHRATVTRSSDGHVVNASGLSSGFSCTVLAQNEVEAVGAQADGRLHLVDRFRPDRDTNARALSALQAAVLSLTQDVHSVLSEGLGMVERIEDMSAIPTTLDGARDEQAALLEASKATHEDRERLLELQQSGHTAAINDQAINLSLDRMSFVKEQVDVIISSISNLVATTGEGFVGDLLGKARAQLLRVNSTARELQMSVEQLESVVLDARDENSQRKFVVEEQSRQLRQLLNQLQEGVGSASRRVAELEERFGQLVALKSGLEERRVRFADLSDERNAKYEELDRLRTTIFSQRSDIARSLSRQLAPAVRVTVTRSLEKSQYRAALVAAFRGSGLHYKALVSSISESVSPAELATWVETAAAAELAAALGVATDRAAAIISALRVSGVAEIISSEINDGVSLELLDGVEYKKSEHLSIGQRCTAVLPVLLGRHGDPLIMDQPEDHLDNSFIASTLVPALNRRSPDDQYIFSSHNANIPVLGNADNVVVLDADGTRGYIKHSGPLDDLRTVDAVTSILEGGLEAFAIRANFYGAQE